MPADYRVSRIMEVLREKLQLPPEESLVSTHPLTAHAQTLFTVLFKKRFSSHYTLPLPPHMQFVYVMQSFAASPMQELRSLYEVSAQHTGLSITQL